jgi:retinol dehydrogenase 12
MGMFSFIVWSIVIGFILYILKKYLNGPRTPFVKSMIGKTVIVTGCNTGIGKETALDLLDKGAKVIFACRSEDRTLAVINQIQDPVQKENAFFMKLDLSNFDSIKKFITQFETAFGKFDVLVNNAGGIFDAFELNEGIESTIMTNHIGPVYLTILLLPLLNQQGLIVNVSSGMYEMISQEKLEQYIKNTDFSQADNFSNPLMNYGFTKLCNVLFALKLDNYARRNNLNYKSASLHPGAVKTDGQNRSKTTLFKIICAILTPFVYLFFKDAKMGAQTTLHIIYSDYNRLNSGAYFDGCAEKNKTQVAENSTNVAKVMKYTYDLIRTYSRNNPKEIDKFFL